MATRSLYGIDFHAPFSLRRDLRLRSTVGGSSVDVTVGDVVRNGREVWRSTAPPEVRCWFDGQTASLHWADAAFAVTADAVVVDAPDAAWAFERYLNSVWSLLIAARGGTAFHAFGVATNCGVVAVMGRSGYGKSELGMALLERGGKLIADDMLTFDADGVLQPGPKFVRSRTSHEELRDPGGKARNPVAAVDGAVELDMVIVLTREATGFVRITPSTAIVDALLSQLYSPIAAHPGVPRRNLGQTVRIAAIADVYACPRRYLPVEELADHTESFLQQRLDVVSVVGHATRRP